MFAIKTKIDSEELKLEKSNNFIGKDVTITIIENFEDEKLCNFFCSAGIIDLDDEEVVHLNAVSMI